MTAVVFDIGGVLIDWAPHLAWQEELGSRDAAQAYMDRVGFYNLNLRADRGELFSDLADEIEGQEGQDRLRSYPDVFERTIQNRVEGTGQILQALVQQDIELHTITNWSMET